MILPQINYNTALKIAIQNDNLEIVKLLLENNKVVGKIRNNMLLDFFANNTSYKYFINHNAIRNIKNDMVLIKAIKTNDIDFIRTVMETNIVKNINSAGVCIMRLAIRQRNVNVVKLLLSYAKIKPELYKFDMHIKKCGFFNACIENYYEMVEFLVTNTKLIYDDNTIYELFAYLFICLSSIDLFSIINLLFQHNIITKNLFEQNKIKNYKLTIMPEFKYIYILNGKKD